MKVLIDIDETLIDKTIWLDVNNLDTEDLELMRYAIRNGTPFGTNGEVLKEVYEGMTNGEVLQAMFPNASVYEHGSIYSVNNVFNFNSTWWNAPYKAESEG